MTSFALKFKWNVQSQAMVILSRIRLMPHQGCLSSMQCKNGTFSFASVAACFVCEHPNWQQQFSWLHVVWHACVGGVSKQNRWVNLLWGCNSDQFVPCSLSLSLWFCLCDCWHPIVMGNITFWTLINTSCFIFQLHIHGQPIWQVPDPTDCRVTSVSMIHKLYGLCLLLGWVWWSQDSLMESCHICIIMQEPPPSWTPS